MRTLSSTWQRMRQRSPQVIGRTLRLTGGAVAAYVVAQQLLPGGDAVLAPLTALLVVQVTLYSTLTAGVQRIASVVSGVVVAVLFSEVARLTWWSLAITVALAILVGQLLRLREHLLEVPISAMLVLSIGGSERGAYERIAETLVGAAVGVIYNFVLPAPVQSRSAGEAVQDLAERIAKLLHRMGDELPESLDLDHADQWLEEARSLARRVARVDTVLVEAAENRRLNVRALGTFDPGPLLRSGLDAIEHATVALRSLCRAVLDHTRDAEREGQEPYSADLRQVFAVLMHDVAEALSAYGRLVREEAEGDPETQTRQLASALEAVGEAQVRLTELILLDRDDTGLELQGVLLGNVSRLLREIDVQERVRQQARTRKHHEQRPPAVLAIERLRSNSRQVVVQPVRRGWSRVHLPGRTARTPRASGNRRLPLPRVRRPRVRRLGLRPLRLKRPRLRRPRLRRPRLRRRR
ncbi:MAG: hypothetical protein AVDCRST_MAG29-1838 [uncultured Nocardioidaceae bacterium]|uniref:Integral membrane bound transporter domain-containing protein n=1 Tax=uncultured Nocardioidaceae bacterium TaxID=253824 RepID=A0A6J4LYF8_9ACTN|nr:MAG: hypothetical protein AVDCRST_MAG29-1838 [uncultured Nocardioidaceae bacterium]